MQSLLNKIFRGSKSILLIRLVGILSGLILTIILTKTLEKNSFGVYTYIVSVVALGSGISQSGMQYLLVREIAKYNTNGLYKSSKSLYLGLTKTAFYISTFLSAVAIIHIYSTNIIDYENKLYISLVVFLSIIMLSQTSICQAVVRGFGFVALGIVTEPLIRQSIQIVVIFILLAMAFQIGLNGLVFVFFASVLISLVFSFWVQYIKTNKYWRGPGSKFTFRKWYQPLIKSAILGWVAVVAVNFPILLSGNIAEAKEISYIKIAYQMALPILLGINVADTKWAPVFAQLHQAEDKRELMKSLKSSRLTSAVIGFAPFLLQVVIGKLLIEVFFGEEYVPAYYSLLVLAFSNYCATFFGSIHPFCYSCGMEKQIIYTQVLSLIVAISLAYVLYYYVGVVGIAMGAGMYVVSWRVILTALVVVKMKTKWL